ncbi:MAG: hypothetical protein DMG32_00725 [Acidobacteria bacterium]|nr:MAG: hypothetical protein DMG32_00725 [Acidobacteriota bacterium]
MKGKTFVLIFALVLAGLATVPLAAQSLLPSSLGTWASSGTPTQVPAQQIEQLANDRANILREYGVTSGERREFANGNDKATVTLYRMVDPSAAFGAFTFLRDPDMALPAPILAASYAADKRGRALLVVGNLVMDVASPKDQMTTPDLNALAQSVAAQADRRPYPPIATFLPKAGLIPGSERYVLGPLALAHAFPPGATNQTDWAGFASSAEAIVGRYRLGEKPSDKPSDKVAGRSRPAEGVLLLILYPTQQLAADRYNALSKSFALNVEPSQAGDKPAVFGTRSSAMIALLARVDSRETAADLLSQIHYASDVTWNEPTHDLTDPSISTIVVGAIVDTGAIMLLALAASLGFGGFRLLAKFLAPGKIFDRNTDVEILQLGISSKPIDVKDFYILNFPR